MWFAKGWGITRSTLSVAGSARSAEAAVNAAMWVSPERLV